jgi:transcriptional regulator with XRE-family HTH domain
LMKLGYQRLLIGYMWLKGYTQPEIARELDTTIHVVRSNIDSFESGIRKATYSDRYDIASALASGMALATLLQRRKEDRDFDRLGKELRERARTEAGGDAAI